MMHVISKSRNKGFTLIEVLIAIVIMAIGLLGMAALQTKAQQAELEASQRAQALLLLQEMTSRMNNNRVGIDCYRLTDASTGTPFVGYGSTTTAVSACGATATREMTDKDFSAWDSMLNGATETLGGNNIGAMIGARGCIMYDATNDIYTVAIAWQGTGITVAPTNNCAKDLYGDDKQRRVVTATLQIANLN